MTPRRRLAQQKTVPLESQQSVAFLTGRPDGGKSSLGSPARRRKLNLPKFEEYPVKIPSFRNERLDLNGSGKRYDLYCFL
jgi:hypothetical protein